MSKYQLLPHVDLIDFLSDFQSHIQIHTKMSSIIRLITVINVLSNQRCQHPQPLKYIYKLNTRKTHFNRSKQTQSFEVFEVFFFVIDYVHELKTKKLKFKISIQLNTIQFIFQYNPFILSSK